MDEKNKGYTEESFAHRAELERKRTKYYRKNVQDITLWSFIREERNGINTGFRFYKLTRETLRERREGVVFPPVVIKKFSLSSMENTLLVSAERNASENGLMISGIDAENPSRMYGFTGAGINCLCDRLRIYGDFARNPSSFRDFLIAERLLLEPKEDTEYVFAALEKNRSRRVTGVFEERYSGSGFWGMSEAYNSVKELSGRFARKLSLREWSVSENEMSVHAEYKDMAVEMGEGKVLIPGIRLINSDSGKRSFTLQTVVRPSETEDLIIINEYRLRHNSSILPEEACAYWFNESFSELCGWLRNVDASRWEIGGMGCDPLRQFRYDVEVSGIRRIIGKKRENIWIKRMEKRLHEDYSDACRNRIWWLFTIHSDLKEEEKGLSDFEAEKLGRLLGKL